MNTVETDALLSMLGTELSPYTFFKDKYALLLAGWAAGEGISVHAMKRSRRGNLLEKPLLKEFSAVHGFLSQTNTQAFAERPGHVFQRGLQTWGWDWETSQTSRPGASIVLRLDLGLDHNRKANRLGVSHALEYLVYRNHMNEGDKFNLAWCRLDLDWETGEVLIEEIQNDWLRTAKGALKERPYSWWYQRDLSQDVRFERYYDTILAPLEPIWAEAMLCAALEFIRNELGLYTVYMHTPECGARLKAIEYRFPPRSIYHDLPKRFCFEQVNEAPAFLSRSWAMLSREERQNAGNRIARPFNFWKLEL